MLRSNKPAGKDMYWFAHGGSESDTNHMQRNSALAEGEDDVHGSNSPTWHTSIERKGSPEDLRVSLSFPHTVPDGGSSSSGPSSLEREDRLRALDKRVAVEERKKLLWEAEQERNDAVLKKHMEREAALEARRNAQRSNISFAFGSSVPRNVETLHPYEGDLDSMSRSFTASGLSQREENHTFHDRRSVSPFNCIGNTLLVDGLSHRPNSAQSCTSYSERKIMPPPNWLVGSGALIGDDMMSRSMHAAIPSASRGRRKNDLMPTVPYERNPTPKPASSSTRKRSVSMTRLDQLAQPRRHYVEATKANSSTGASGMLKDSLRSPTRPLSSASEHSGGSGRVPSTVTRRVRSSPRKPRPISIAGTIPDPKLTNMKPFEAKLSPVKRNYTPSKQTGESNEIKKTGSSSVKSASAKSGEKIKPTPRPLTAPKASTPKPSTFKATKPTENKSPASKPATTPKTPTPKVKEKKSQPVKKKIDLGVSSPLAAEVKEKVEAIEKPNDGPSTVESDVAAENERNNAKRIISEEEAKAALAEKRRLAREQAEREAELERQRQEELKREEEERLRKEEEEQRKMEEEQIRLLEEHKRLEEEKLRKAIEDQEQKEEEERARRDEELRLKAEQEKKAKEEAEKQRLELEEKLRKEEEERAERKKRLEKIMSRTRGKSSGTSPSGSVSGSDQLDSAENPHEGFSSGANSLDSNETGELPSEPVSVDDNLTKAEISSTGDSMENNPTYEIGSENESLNSNDLMMPVSETASQDNSLVIIPEKPDSSEQVSVIVDASSTATSVSAQDKRDEPLADPQISENEDISVSASSSSTRVPTVTGLENINVVPLESQILETEDVKTDLPSPHDNFISLENENLMSEYVLEKEQLPVDNDVQEAISQSVQSECNTEYDSQKCFEQPQVEECQDVLKSTFNANIESEEIISPEKDVAFWSEQHVSPTKELTDDFNKDSDDKMVTASAETSENHVEFSTQQFDLSAKEQLNVNSAIPSDSLATDYAFESEFSETNMRTSISSDIKLPDPIYETSEDGSISSEKQLQDFKLTSLQDDFNYMRTGAVSDDVFSEQNAEMNSEFGQQNQHKESDYLDKSNPFLEHNADGLQRSSFDKLNEVNVTHKFDTDESNYEKESIILPDVLDQPHETEDVNSVPLSSSILEKDVYPMDSDILQPNAEPPIQDMLGNKENIENIPQFSIQNDEVSAVDAFDIYSNKENIFSQEISSYSAEVSQLEENTHNLASVRDNPFTTEPFSDTPLLLSGMTSTGVMQPQTYSEFGTDCNFENENVTVSDVSSKHEEASDVTYIKDDSSGACIGIISSVEHDHVSNDFPKPDLHSEQLKNNFDYPSVTDSEDSSLDSNLSQIMTVENSEKNTISGLNHVENSTVESNSSDLVHSNGEQHDNPFATEHIYNHGSISKTNGSSFSTSEMLSNGHGVQSSNCVSEEISEFHEYMQLDGNSILSVDHSKNNIYENVDAIDYGKVSPDPFLAKGNSKQVSGNPFLLQDDQKQVLMTPDFLN